MKKIGILTCLKATGICSGASCFNAFNKREKSFEVYDDHVELTSFFHCNGCRCNYKTDKEYKEKIQRIIDIGTEVVHFGKCTIIKGTECHVITKIGEELQAANIKVIRGTH